MSTSFNPLENIDLYCRSCEKVTPAQLDRGIAGSGKTIDRNSVFEYCCTKCFKTNCYSGTDLLENTDGPQAETRSYSPREHFFIGEMIFHKKFAETGLVVGKDNSSTGKILVQFQQAGLVKLVQGL